MATIQTFNNGETGASVRSKINTSLTNLNSDKAETSALTSGLAGKQDIITLTTTGSSGPATLIGATLNIPQYSGGVGSSTFLGLTDTPSSYTGQNGKILQVNAGETGIEFATISGGGDMLKSENLSGLTNYATARSNLGLSTTANQTDSTDKRFMSDAQETKLDAISGTNTGDETTTRINALYSTTNAFTSGTIELGHATDTTISRVSAGKIAVEGVNVGTEGILQNSQSAAYTLVLTDAGKSIYHPSADTTARTWTIPANSSVAFPIGTAITFVNDTSAGTLTIAITTDTLVFRDTGATGSRTLTANGIATAIKVSATRWFISGSGNLT